MFFGQVAICKDVMQAVEGADGLVLVTDWECFRTIDMPRGEFAACLRKKGHGAMFARTPFLCTNLPF